MTIRNYIKNKKIKHFTTFGVEVFIKDEVTNGVPARAVINKALKKIPNHLLSNLDSIYIGEFDFLKDREAQAVYENSSIFVTNEQDSELDMLDDIVHEIAHSVEEKYAQQIYQDKKIESEFLHKRKNAWMLLRDNGIDSELQDFLNLEYSEDFDSFLYHDVGYPTLAMVTANLFYSPYALTSLNEYFANGFEAFYAGGDISRLKAISPAIYSKIAALSLMEEY